MKQPFIMIVIPFKGQIDTTINCLKSLTKNYTTGYSYSIILVDDGSTDQEIEYLYQNKIFDCTIVKNNHEGYTKRVQNIFNVILNNHPEYDYILLANNDIIFEPSTIYYLSKRMTTNCNISAVGCKVLQFNSNTILHTGTRLENGQIIDPYVGLDKNDIRTNFVERRLWVNGCCTLYNAHILRKHNLNFDLDFSPAYFEESDLMTRLNVLGYSVLYEPKAIIQHIMNKTTGEERDKYQEIFSINWNKYLNKWKPYFHSKGLQF